MPARNREPDVMAALKELGRATTEEVAAEADIGAKACRRHLVNLATRGVILTEQENRPPFRKVWAVKG